MSIRVVIADDQDLIRGALAALLGRESDLEVVAEADSGEELIEIVRAHRPDVALVDIEMPGISGIEAVRKLRELNEPCRCLMVTTFGRPGYLHRAVEAGAVGFVVKDSPPARLADAVRRAHRGLRTVDPVLEHQAALQAESPLTQRETEVCRAALTGARVQQIARQLHLSGGTVRNHLSNVIGKTGAANRHEAVRIAEENGWL